MCSSDLDWLDKLGDGRVGFTAIDSGALLVGGAKHPCGAVWDLEEPQGSVQVAQDVVGSDLPSTAGSQLGSAVNCSATGAWPVWVSARGDVQPAL